MPQIITLSVHKIGLKECSFQEGQWNSWSERATVASSLHPRVGGRASQLSICHAVETRVIDQISLAQLCSFPPHHPLTALGLTPKERCDLVRKALLAQQTYQDLRSPVCYCLVAKSPNSCDPRDCSPPGSSVHGISQLRILEWVVMPSSRGSSWPRDQTQVSKLSRLICEKK